MSPYASLEISGWEAAAKELKEIPTGGSFRQIWIQVAVYPMFATVALASVACGGFMYKYFAGHTDIKIGKSIRGDHDVGVNEKRVEAHNGRFGFRSLNKGEIHIFPFNYQPMNKIIDDHRFDK